MTDLALSLHRDSVAASSRLYDYAREREVEIERLGAARDALLALTRWLGESHDPPTLPLHLHAQIREALGDDFYREVVR